MESRSIKAGRNISVGLLLKLYQIAFPFILRTVILRNLGVNYVGLGGLFKSILSVLNLAELGVGSAMVFSMYKPIAENNSKKICALLCVYKKYYYLIGGIIALIGLCIMPIVPRLIKKDVPEDINLFVLYLISLFTSVISYWLYAYKGSLFLAHQRSDVLSKISIISNTIMYVSQIAVLILTKNYYLFTLLAFFCQILDNILISFFASKYYPEYKAFGVLPIQEKKKINSRIRDLFTARFGYVITNSFDTIVVSAFLGLVCLTTYQNYYFIVESIYSIVVVFFTSVTAGIGNSLITETIDKNYGDLEKFTFLTCVLTTVFTCCFAVLCQPFMVLWVGSKLLLDDSYVFVFCLYFYFLVLGMALASIKDAAGLWEKDRFRPLIGALVNLFLNLVTVRFIGLYGVLLSTIICYAFVSVPWLIHNLFSQLYKRSAIKYIKNLLFYLFIGFICVFLSIVVSNKLIVDGFIGMIVRAFVALFISIFVQFLIFRNTLVYRDSKNLLIDMIIGGMKR